MVGARASVAFSSLRCARPRLTPMYMYIFPESKY